MVNYVLSVSLIGFIVVLFLVGVLIILHESVDAMTRLADMLLFNTSTLSLIISIVNHNHKDQY